MFSINLHSLLEGKVLNRNGIPFPHCLFSELTLSVVLFPRNTQLVSIANFAKSVFFVVETFHHCFGYWWITAQENIENMYFDGRR